MDAEFSLCSFCSSLLWGRCLTAFRFSLLGFLHQSETPWEIYVAVLIPQNSRTQTRVVSWQAISPNSNLYSGILKLFPEVLLFRRLASLSVYFKRVSFRFFARATIDQLARIIAYMAGKPFRIERHKPRKRGHEAERCRNLKGDKKAEIHSQDHSPERTWRYNSQANGM